MTKETDSKTGETVSYFYDKAGRRTRLVSRERDISYGYGKNSELLSQKERLKQLEVHYKYDVCGREIERRFGNGVRQLTFYDKAGRTICIRQVNSSDRLLSGEAYVYDKAGRRSLTVNDKGLVTIYKYDNQSRLETVYYPFNEDIKETARKEADKQGLYFQPSQGTAENYFLSTGELLQLKAVAECIANGRSGAITVNQVVWKESYTYDANGNRTSKTTAWGTVEYSYDKENRLVESGNLGMSESVKYTYDANGNLLRESAARYRKDYTYNAQNRMSFSDVQDSVLNTRNFTEYVYDAFGRRIETRQYLGDYTRNLYDGFSFDIIGKSVLQSAYSANIPEQIYRTPSTQRHPELVSGSTSNGRNERGTEIGTRYRYIDDTPLVPMTEAGKANGTNAASSASGAKTRSRPNNEYVLYSYGEPVAMSADGNASYFGTDILGSVRNVTDKYGAVQSSYDYDVFGSPYLGNLENDICFGYCGKVYDIGTGLYDYGFRDYSPNSARFTTVDPIRDGSNWFSYVVNDPVNYVDLYGLISGEIYNATNHYLFPRAEDTDTADALLKGGFKIGSGETLSTALSNYGHEKIKLDVLVLPDKSVYKGWTGSKITVTETKNDKGEISFHVTQSFGTIIMNFFGNVIKAGKNLVITLSGSNSQKEEYYKFYTVKEVNIMEINQKETKGTINEHSITILRDEKNLPKNYFNQNITNTDSSSNVSFSSISKGVSLNVSSVYGDTSILPTTKISSETVINNFASYARNSLTSGILGFSKGCTK